MKTDAIKLTLRTFFFVLSLGLVILCHQVQGSDIQTRVSRNVVLQNLLNEKSLQTLPQFTVHNRTRLSSSTESIVLSATGSGLPPFRLYMKSPANATTIQRLVLIVPGMATEIDKLVDIAPALQNTVLLAFDFYIPWTTAPARFIQQVQEIPFQVALALGWMHQTYQVPMSVVSVSLGTFFHPAAVGFLQRWRIQVESHVFAFGGADLTEIAKSFGQARELIEALSQNTGLTQFIDPRFFLPVLRGKSMFLEAEADEVFSLHSRNAYFADIPTPKERVQVAGGHLNQNQPWAIFTALQAIFKFLQIAPEAPASFR